MMWRAAQPQGPRERLITFVGDRPGHDLRYARAIINCATYTAIDKAESDSGAAQAIHAFGPEYLARVAADLDIPFLHVSTDYVFDGAKSGAYTEEARRAARCLWAQQGRRRASRARRACEVEITDVNRAYTGGGGSSRRDHEPRHCVAGYGNTRQSA
jgi:hypothetical protein